MTLHLTQPAETGPGGAAAEGMVDTRPSDNGSGAMFDTIADRYDLLNRVLSAGLDRRWRRKTIEALELAGGARVLDLATGTADLALELVRRHPDASVCGLDPAVEMLAIGRAKAERRGFLDRIDLQEGDAQAVPFADASFDAVTIAFGIRNVPDRELALAEMARVVRPGGRVAILELGEPRSGLLARLCRFHIHTVVPVVGGLISGRPAYRYLERSIGEFPPAEQFSRQISNAGLEMLRIVPFSFGVCHLYLAERPLRQPRATST